MHFSVARARLRMAVSRVLVADDVDASSLP
jgi:hypothetical protein